MCDRKAYYEVWALAHQKELKSYRQQYYIQNKKEMKEKSQKYGRTHEEESNIAHLKLRHKKGIYKKYNTGISKTPEYKKMSQQKYNLLLRNAGPIDFQTIQEVYDDNIISNLGVLRCIYCQKELTRKQATLEHKQPISRGGTNKKENLAIACLYCNSSKKDRTVEEFIIANGLRRLISAQSFTPNPVIQGLANV